jgi:hypothetical protein
MFSAISRGVAPGWYSGGPFALLKIRPNREGQGPSHMFSAISRGVAPGWYSGGPLALLKIRPNREGQGTRLIPAWGNAPGHNFQSFRKGLKDRPIPPVAP